MRNEIVVQKLAEYAKKILRYCEGVDYGQFSSDSKLAEACVFNLSQMGELANRIDDAYALAHPQIPWRYIYGLRNRIVHDYEGVNLLLIWQIIHEDLPDLLKNLTDIIAH